MTQTTESLVNAQKSESVNSIEARDALLGCFVVIHGETLRRGAKILGKDLSHEEVESHAKAQMKMLMGDNYDTPSKESLNDVKPKLDQKMNFSKVDKDLKDMHDQVCNMILTKIK
ncbi:MAG: hypothetical protein HYZ10_06535 [Ignavibacteriales bacterium]|nr:hypothetical protein [Ignavibacteriales bacterium]